MDENKEVNSTDPRREKVRVIPLSAIDDAPDHPFGVRDDEEMAELVESISTFGVRRSARQCGIRVFLHRRFLLLKREKSRLRTPR